MRTGAQLEEHLIPRCVSEDMMERVSIVAYPLVRFQRERRSGVGGPMLLSELGSGQLLTLQVLWDLIV